MKLRDLKQNKHKENHTEVHDNLNYDDMKGNSIAEAGKQNLCYTEDSNDKNARRWLFNYFLTCLVADMLETKNTTQKAKSSAPALLP